MFENLLFNCRHVGVSAFYFVQKYSKKLQVRDLCKKNHVLFAVVRYFLLTIMSCGTSFVRRKV
nr:MAG TPA: hypothetical protein [Caudoviricetes sp.]